MFGQRIAPRLRPILIGGTALLVIALQLAGSFLPDASTPIDRLDLAARDNMMRVRGVRPPSGNVVIVAIDDESFGWTGYQWPWPRSYLAQIVDAVNKGGARVVALDIFLSEPDKDPAGDVALAKALSESQAAVLDMEIYLAEPEAGITGVVVRKPQSIYLDAKDGLGIASIFQDKDAITRRILAYYYSEYDQTNYYNWAFEAARLYKGAAEPTAPSNDELTFDGGAVPLQSQKMIVDFAGPAGTYPTYSAYQVVLGDVLEMNPDAFKDKVVLIGATSVSLHDVYPTPFSAQKPTPGVEIIANAIDTILGGQFLRQTPLWAALLLILGMAALAVLITRNQRPGRTILLLTAGMLAYVLIAYFIFVIRGLYLPVAGPEAMLFLGVVLPTLEQAVSQELEKRRVHNLFTRFISPEMVNQMIATQDLNSLNKRANVSILFSDIRGFTTLSEKLSPEEVVGMLNPYLEVMTDIIHQHGGTVDKYEGDAIIAFFGEPVAYADHAARAVQTAIDMRKGLLDLGRRWEREERPIKQFEIGIGVNSGEVFVGLLGSAQRINYTIIGDNVNLASRLQDLTKTYQWPVLISESTYQQVKESFETELVDSVTVKGKTEPVNIYKVVGRKGAPEDQIQPLETALLAQD
jgi:adenylate cyclase